MLKKLSFSALTLCLSVVAFAKDVTNTGSDPKALAKDAALVANVELLTKMQNQLGTNEGDKVNNLKKIDPNQQFLYVESKINDLGLKNNDLASVYNYLVKNQNGTLLDTEAVFANNVEFKTIESGKKEGQKDSSVVVVPVTFQTNAVAKDGMSDVKYQVNFTWEVKVAPVKSKKTKTDDGTVIVPEVSYKVNGVPKLVASNATPISYLNSDLASMQAAAEAAIEKWYAEELPSVYMTAFADMKPIESIAPRCESKEINVNRPASPVFVVKEGMPIITVSIDPYQFISQENSSFYTNPTAFVEYAPTFKVKVDDTYKNATVEVTYDKVKTVEPVTDSIKIERNNAAAKFINDYATKLQSYVTSLDTAQGDEYKALFVSCEDPIVMISKVYTNGKVKTTSKSVSKYVSQLKKIKDATMTNSIVEYKPEANFTEVSYTLSQQFRSRNYNDTTVKTVVLKYDEEQGVYRVVSVNVLSTEKN